MSSKYSEQVIEAACEAIDWAEGLVVTDTLAIDVFDSLERAPWWEEVEVGYEFTIGEPHRVESPSGVSSERATTYNFTISAAHQSTYFRDTRWQPPAKPLKVGDLIATEEQVESLPIGTIVVTEGNTAFRKAGISEWRLASGGGSPLADIYMAGDGDRVIYLPNGDSA